MFYLTCDPGDPWGPMLEQAVPEGLPPMGKKGSMQKQFVESYLPCEGPQLEEGKDSFH